MHAHANGSTCTFSSRPGNERSRENVIQSASDKQRILHTLWAAEQVRPLVTTFSFTSPFLPPFDHAPAARVASDPEDVERPHGRGPQSQRKQDLPARSRRPKMRHMPSARAPCQEARVSSLTKQYEARASFCVGRTASQDCALNDVSRL